MAINGAMYLHDGKAIIEFPDGEGVSVFIQFGLVQLRAFIVKLEGLAEALEESRAKA